MPKPEHDADRRLTIAHSPDPDDAFMWWPLGTRGLTGGPAHAPELDPAIDTEGFVFTPLAVDIQELNRRAIEIADVDVTAISMHAFGAVRDRYVLTDCGASFGDGYGPKVLTPPGAPLPHAKAKQPDRAEWLAGMLRDGATVAIPGFETSAYLVLRSMTGEAGAVAAERDQFRPMRFDRIVPAILSGEADAGLVIHEAQVTYADQGLGLVIDLGQWWHDETAGLGGPGESGLPLPLGANAVKRDLITRFGPDAHATVSRVLRRSIRHALDHRDGGIDYAAAFATAGGDQPVARELVDRFVGLYVNDLTLSMGERGRRAVEELLRRGEAMRLIASSGPTEIV